jgi:hypothetical protein
VYLPEILGERTEKMSKMPRFIALVVLSLVTAWTFYSISWESPREAWFVSVDRDLRREDVDNGRSLIEAQLDLGTDLSLDASNVPANSPIVSNVESDTASPTKSPAVEAPAVTKQSHEMNLEEAKRLAKQLLNTIYYRYEINKSIGKNFMYTTNNAGKDTFDIIKYKYLTKALKGDQKFLMIFGGSSVTASHDNYYNQSYPATVNHRMGPILNAMGIELVVHNIAQGANNCIPYQFCYNSMGGDDADFMNWEQSYNCGRDEPIFELAARIAGYSKALIYFSASGAWSPKDCPASTDKPPYSDFNWTPESAGLEVWDATSKNVASEIDKIIDYHSAKPSSSRFSNIVSSKEYRSVGAHGFNVWEQNPKCQSKKDGKETTNCNGIDAAQVCTMKFMTSEAGAYGSDNGKGANWHPTRAFHMLRGEAIAWLYTLALLDGIYELEEALAKGKSKPDLLQEYGKKLGDLQPKLPAPKKCQKYLCEYRPYCYTDYRPHYNEKYSLHKIVVGKTNWTYEPEDLGDWSLHYGYLDAKPLYYTQGNMGEIHVLVNVEKVGTVWLCGAVKESLLNSTIYLDQNVKGDDFTNYIPTSSRKKWEKRKYVGNECKEITGLPVGRHVLSISTENSSPGHKTALSHVITW